MLSHFSSLNNDNKIISDIDKKLFDCSDIKLTNSTGITSSAITSTVITTYVSANTTTTFNNSFTQDASVSISSLSKQTSELNLISTNSRHLKPLVIESNSNTTDSFPRIFKEFDFLEAERDSISESTDSCFNWLSTMRSSRCALCHGDGNEIDEVDIGDDHEDEYLGIEETEYYDEDEANETISEKNISVQYESVIDCFGLQSPATVEETTLPVNSLKMLLQQTNENILCEVDNAKKKPNDNLKVFQSLRFSSFNSKSKMFSLSSGNLTESYKKAKTKHFNIMANFFSPTLNSSKLFEKKNALKTIDDLKYSYNIYNDQQKTKDNNSMHFFSIEKDNAHYFKLLELLQQNLFVQKYYTTFKKQKIKYCINFKCIGIISKYLKFKNKRIYRTRKTINLFKRRLKEEAYNCKLITSKNIKLYREIFFQLQNFLKQNLCYKQKSIKINTSSISQQFNIVSNSLNTDNTHLNFDLFKTVFEPVKNNVMCKDNTMCLFQKSYLNDFSKLNTNKEGTNFSNSIFFQQNSGFPLECSHHLTEKVIFLLFKSVITKSSIMFF